MRIRAEGWSAFNNDGATEDHKYDVLHSPISFAVLGAGSNNDAYSPASRTKPIWRVGRGEVEKYSERSRRVFALNSGENLEVSMSEE